MKTRADELRRKATLCRRAASIPTTGSAGTDRMLIALAEQLECDALLATLEEIRESLAYFYTPEEVEVWLKSPQVLLQGKTALSLIEAGELTPVIDVIRQLRDSTYT